MKELSAESVLALHGLHLMLRASTPVSPKEIRQSAGCPSRQVREVLHKLRMAGLVRITGGHGFVLAKAPGEISILEVVRAMDAPQTPKAPCSGDYDACATRATCILAPLCKKAEEASQETLRAVTLADFVDVPVDLPNCLDPKLRPLAG